MIDTDVLELSAAEVRESRPYPYLATGMYSEAILHDPAYVFSKLGLPTIIGVSLWYLILSNV